MFGRRLVAIGALLAVLAVSLIPASAAGIWAGRRL